MKIKPILFLILLTVSLSMQGAQESYPVVSPDGQVKLNLFIKNNSIHYSLDWLGKNMIKSGVLALFEDRKVVVEHHKISNVDHDWEMVWGQQKKMRDHYQELELKVAFNTIKGRFLARVYNEGVAFRFILDDSNGVKDVLLQSSYTPIENSVFYLPNGEQEPLGPLSLKELAAEQEKITKKKKKKALHIPIVIETPKHGFMAVLESDLYESKGFETMKIAVDLNKNALVSKNKGVVAQAAFKSPWRVILLGKTVGDLSVNPVTMNLATPCKIENTDWIKPGKSLWDWRVHGFKAKDGFTYGINNESYYRFIDFAAENDIEYFLIDDAWYTNIEPGQIEMSEKLDLEKVIKYADKKGVDILLYYDRRKGSYGDDKLFDYYKSLGVKGIKYGFMGNKAEFTRDAVKLSSDSQLLIDFHDGPVPLTGVTRTYPNAVTREYCHAQQDSKKAFSPRAFVRMALINGIQGPLDMNNGIFDISGVNAGEREKGPKIRNSLHTTVTAEVARTLIVFSGLVCLPDAPEAYGAKQDIFEFIKKMPVGKWDESKVIHSKIDGYISSARRYNDAWFIGSVHVDGGALDIPLDFLETNKTYTVTYYEDTLQTNSETNAEAYQVRTATVKKGDVVKAEMVAGGGHCMWIRPIN
ncbi:glycoside hydrolase family 97 protein [Tamlana agarivorans]|uniref:Glycoside hydrolase family 97 protein n=1 Tax=Pseudotamlana agarivorans TaxID=481183 RepID=A0ACC5U992_9FLAO|nr:glycoside hydrolase family 97 protein [Tamlana agarivorans]MBU2950898.1 glycoside hydrolase family 97 protein [Tamlana agarivorans]